MNPLFWSRFHGAVTHFPIVFIFGAALFELLGFFSRTSPRQRDFRTISYCLVGFGGVGSFAAVLSGLLLTNWKVRGTGALLRHHIFVWPAFALIIGLATWRLLVVNAPSRRAFTIYLSLMAIACGLIGAAGFFGGEMLISHSIAAP